MGIAAATAAAICYGISVAILESDKHSDKGSAIVFGLAFGVGSFVCGAYMCFSFVVASIRFVKWVWI